MHEVSNLINVTGEKATVHDVCKSFRFKQCKAKTENTFQTVYKGNGNITSDASTAILYTEK